MHPNCPHLPLLVPPPMQAVMLQLYTKEQIMIEKNDEAQNGFLHCTAPAGPRATLTNIVEPSNHPMNKTNE